MILVVPINHNSNESEVEIGYKTLSFHSYTDLSVRPHNCNTHSINGTSLTISVFARSAFVVFITF